MKHSARLPIRAKIYQHLRGVRTITLCDGNGIAPLAEKLPPPQNRKAIGKTEAELMLYGVRKTRENTLINEKQTHKACARSVAQLIFMDSQSCCARIGLTTISPQHNHHHFPYTYINIYKYSLDNVGESLVTSASGVPDEYEARCIYTTIYI